MSTPLGSIAPRTLAVAVTDHLVIYGAVLLSARLRLGMGWSDLILAHVFIKAFLVACVCQLCLYYVDLYDLRNTIPRQEAAIRLVQGLGATSFVLAVLYFWVPTLMIGRGVFVIASALVLISLAIWRLLFDWVARLASPRERLLLLGTSQGSVALARELFERRNELGVDIVGFIDPDPLKVGTPVLNPGVIGTIEQIPDIVRSHDVNRVVVGLSDARGMLPMDQLLEMKFDGVQFDHLASIYEEYTGKIAVENLRPSWFIFSTGFKKSIYVHGIKRGIDAVIAAVALLVVSPLLLLIALAVKVSSRGPVFYHQQRVGAHGRVFTIHKFRSMQTNAEAATGAVWATKNDSRVTRIGRFLRRSRLDELPQIWNILKGEMSLVGPRPERPEFVRDLTEQIPFYRERHVLRPGLTGWAQVRYTYGANVEDALEKLQYDLYYIKNISLALDLFIIFATAKAVILRRGGQ